MTTEINRDYNGYPEVPGITPENFELGEGGIPWDQYERAHEELRQYATTQQANFLGYQTNQNLDYASYAPYLNGLFNNIGDPFTSGNFTMNTKFMERMVLDYFARLWHANAPHVDIDPENPQTNETYWGYVVSMGSSESNVFGLWNARDYLAGRELLVDEEAAVEAKLASEQHPGILYSAKPRVIANDPVPPVNNPNYYTPIAFYSQDTHYSVVKSMRALNIKTFYEEGMSKYPGECPLGEEWPKEVPSNPDGSINIDALYDLVKFFVLKGYPVIISLNYGTTFKGAYDDVEAAVAKLKSTNLLQYPGDVEPVSGQVRERNNFWIHVDGALSASYAPYLINGEKASWKLPNFDFAIPEVCSVLMSGHKFPGAPWPCGVFMTRTKYQLEPPANPHYLGSPDSTFAGSRNGFSAMILWDYIAKNSKTDLTEKATKAERMAAYLEQQLRKVQEQPQMPDDIWVERTPNSITVHFKKMADDLVFKYSLSSEIVYVNGEQREYNHIFCMDHVDEALIDQLIADVLAHPNPFPEQHLNDVTE